MKRLLAIGVLIMLALTADTVQAKGATLARLEIPSLGIAVDVVEARQTARSWDFTDIVSTVGWLEGTANFGSMGNAVVGGHNDTVFKSLPRLTIGSLVIVTMGNRRYVYKMVNAYAVNVTNMLPVQQFWKNSLTLITCYVHDSRLRYVVQAELIEVKYVI